MIRERIVAAFFAFALLSVFVPHAHAQAGRRTAPAGEGARLVNVVATRTDGAATPVSVGDISLYDDGVEQRIQGFSPDPSPARIVLLVDNSQTLRTDAEKLATAAREFAYEIYEGDQILTIAYDETPEIVHEWTDAAKTIDASVKLFRKKGEPRLLDAFDAVIEQALRPLTGASRKLAVVVVADGLDRESKKKFSALLADLQRLDIAVYALQLPDRTGGAHRRDVPKPGVLLRDLAEGTGGRVFAFDEARTAAAAICDELRKNRYVLAYTPSHPTITDAHRLLVVGNAEGLELRHKLQQPPR